MSRKLYICAVGSRTHQEHFWLELDRLGLAEPALPVFQENTSGVTGEQVYKDLIDGVRRNWTPDGKETKHGFGNFEPTNFHYRLVRDGITDGQIEMLDDMTDGLDRVSDELGVSLSLYRHPMEDIGGTQNAEESAKKLAPIAERWGWLWNHGYVLDGMEEAMPWDLPKHSRRIVGGHKRCSQYGRPVITWITPKLQFDNETFYSRVVRLIPGDIGLWVDVRHPAMLDFNIAQTRAIAPAITESLSQREPI